MTVDMGTVSAKQRGFLHPWECRLDRRVFRSDDLQREFDERGYVVVPFISASEVATLYDGYARVADSDQGTNPPGAYNDTFAEFSIVHSWPQFRRDAFSLISSTLGPAADALLVDYRPLFANYVNKPPGTGVVPVHQNFSVVDESRLQSVSVWVALVDCTVGNGAMSMLDGSHRHLRGRRGMWAYQVFSEIEEHVVTDLLHPITVKAGDAIVLDDAVLHYSPPNRSDQRRLAIQFVMVPAEADALWFRQVAAADAALEVDVLRVEPPFFFEFDHGDGDLAHATRLGGTTVDRSPLDLESLRALLAE